MAAAAGQPCLHLSSLAAHEMYAATVVFSSNCAWRFAQCSVRVCCADCGHGAAGSVGATEGFPAYMQEVFGTHDTRLEPRSTMRSAFQQRLQALDSPQMLSAVISQGSWPPKDAISRCESSFQLAAPMSPTGSGSSSVVRKRKGYSILSDRGRPPRKSKAEGVFAKADPSHELARQPNSIFSTHNHCSAPLI